MKRVIIQVIRAYQALSRSVPPSPILLGSFSGCRSWPTCSDYALDVIEREGALKGSAKAVVRVMQCNPIWQTQHHG